MVVSSPVSRPPLPGYSRAGRADSDPSILDFRAASGRSSLPAQQQDDAEVQLPGQALSPDRVPAISPNNLTGVAQTQIVMGKGLGLPQGELLQPNPRFAINGHNLDQFWLKASGNPGENLLSIWARHAVPILKTRSAALPGDELFIRIWYF